jgi:hypothetical protein
MNRQDARGFGGARLAPNEGWAIPPRRVVTGDDAEKSVSDFAAARPPAIERAARLRPLTPLRRPALRNWNARVQWTVIEGAQHTGIRHEHRHSVVCIGPGFCSECPLLCLKLCLARDRVHTARAVQATSRSAGTDGAVDMGSTERPSRPLPVRSDRVSADFGAGCPPRARSSRRPTVGVNGRRGPVPIL